MKNKLLLVLPGVALLLSGCATSPPPTLNPARAQQIEESLAKRQQALTRETEEKILALNPEHVTDTEIREVLTNVPAPRIINIHGGVLPYHLSMDSFSEFLIGMGYPEWSIRNPGTGAYSLSCYQDSKQIAGMIGWCYEKEGMRPMMLGHSLGGIQVVKVLYDLADQSANRPALWNPLTGRTEDRHEITDPLTGKSCSLAGLQLCYASAVGAGGLARTLPYQWEMGLKLRKIPDTVEEFTGFYIGMDVWGGDYLGYGSANLFRPSGKALVRNVRLPTSYSHATVPNTKVILTSQAMKDWVSNYTPTNQPSLEEQSFKSNSHILWAADVWYSIKRHWVLELQILVRANRDLHHEP
jgi:hypothetical protein